MSTLAPGAAIVSHPQGGRTFAVPVGGDSTVRIYQGLGSPQPAPHVSAVPAAPAIASIAITWNQLALLQDAETGPVRVAGGRISTAHNLVDKDLGTLGQTNRVWIFDITAAGRDQLRIRR